MKKIVCLFVCLFVGTANASIIYDVNRTIDGGSVVGSIITDGTLGGLITSNFTDWELTVNDGFGSFTLFGPDSVSTNSNLLLTSSSFIATASDLLFDFSANGFALFQNPSNGSGMNWWCLDGTNTNCAHTGEGTESVHVLNSTEFIQHSGQVIIASTGNSTVPVPEPASIALLALGLAGIGFSRKKKAA